MNENLSSGVHEHPFRAAFKEWASVIQAMEQGQQSVLLRKGGISEDAGRFRIEHSQFWLFPTFEHQDARYLRPEWSSLVDETIRSQDHRGRIRISSLAHVERAFIGPSLDAVRQLGDHYIWNDRYVESRFRLQPSEPLYLTLLRVYVLPQPVFIDYIPEYGGCRSWISLKDPIIPTNAAPALSDPEMRALEEELSHYLGSAGVLPEALDPIRHASQ